MEITKSRGARKQSQISKTLTWLGENYERADGVCLPRSVFYTHYLDFCKTHGFSPAGPATFGKIIRQPFPKLTTRRLGTRGQSKYHYYGIGIKLSSKYYHSVYNGKGLTRFSTTKVKTEGSSRKYSLSSKAGTLLPELPAIHNICLPEHLQPDKVETLFLMYRTHCQRILDSVIAANFEEIESLLLHLWHGMPDHLSSLLDEQLIEDIICFCDSNLYRVIADTLLPPTVQDLPDGLGCEIRAFLNQLPVWMNNAMENIPEKLTNSKLSVLKQFVLNMGRHQAFITLAQVARPVLLNPECIQAIVADLGSLDLLNVFQQAAAIMTMPEECGNLVTNGIFYVNELRNLLEKQTTIETYTEWMDNIIDVNVLQKVKGGSDEELKLCAGEFMLIWNSISAYVMKALTFISAKSFDNCHVLNLMLEEYCLLVLETQLDSTREKLELTNVNQYLRDSSTSFSREAKVRQSKTGRKRDSEEVEEEEEEEDEDSPDYESPAESVNPQSPSSINKLSPNFQTADVTRHVNPQLRAHQPKVPADTYPNLQQIPNATTYGYQQYDSGTCALRYLHADKQPGTYGHEYLSGYAPFSHLPRKTYNANGASTLSNLHSMYKHPDAGRLVNRFVDTSTGSSQRNDGVYQNCWQTYDSSVISKPRPPNYPLSHQAPKYCNINSCHSYRPQTRVHSTPQTCHYSNVQVPSPAGPVYDQSQHRLLYEQPRADCRSNYPANCIDLSTPPGEPLQQALYREHYGSRFYQGDVMSHDKDLYSRSYEKQYISM